MFAQPQIVYIWKKAKDELKEVKVKDVIEVNELTVVDDELDSLVRQSIGQVSGVVDPSVEFPEIRQRSVPHPDHQIFILEETKFKNKWIDFRYQLGHIIIVITTLF